MKGKISEHGCLKIRRPPGYFTQECVNDDSRSCGDRCVAFREPVNSTDTDGHEIHHIVLCFGVLEFEELIDERGKK